MPSQITNYQCPACTGPLHYSSKTGKMECEYCGSSFTVYEIEAFYKEKNEQAEEAFNAAAQSGREEEIVDGLAADWDLQHAGSAWGAEGAGLRAYSCPSCGAELICDETTAATSCPYCGNPSIVPGQFSGSLMPDLIVPFKLDKEAAKAALREHFRGKKLLPKAFSSENHLDEIKGVYVPFWLFDTNVDADMSFNATRMRSWSDRSFNYTETRYYKLYRSGVIRFENVPVDGSDKMPWNRSSPSTPRGPCLSGRAISRATSPTATTSRPRTASAAPTSASATARSAHSPRRPAATAP